MSFVLWFQQALAHDAVCEDSGVPQFNEPVSGEEYYRSLLDSPPSLTPDQMRALKGDKPRRWTRRF